ncbi:MAG: metal-dependent phosphohydrolase, partial [Desulfobulbus sp.]
MTVPDIPTCIQLMDEYAMLTNIRHHSLVVAKVADALLTGLADESGRAPLANEKLVIAGALLHDIAKTPCLNSGCDHAARGAEICLRNGYPEVAQIVKEHVILAKHDPARYKNGLFTAG